MAYPDVTLKIHHIDGDMTAPWEYYDTFMQCGVGTPMAMANIVVAPYKFAAMMVQGGGGSEAIRNLWISMAENAEGLTNEEIMNGSIDDDSDVLSYLKPIPLVYIRNDMVLESTSYDNLFASGTRVVMVLTGETLDCLSWINKAVDTSDGYPTFLVIDAQPMVEGQELPQKLLLRYIG